MSVDVQLVFENEVSHLFDLISLRLVSKGLQVDNFVDFRPVEDDVTAFALTRMKPPRSRRWQRSAKATFASERPERMSARIFRVLLMEWRAGG